jgi:hypothetical protein
MNNFIVGNIARIKHDYGYETVIISEDNIDSKEISGLPVLIETLENNLGFVSTTFTDRIEIMKDVGQFLIKYITNNTDRFNFIIYDNLGIIAKFKIDYIHQLQNIFKALTGLCLA